jgi:hypothetical protein
VDNGPSLSQAGAWKEVLVTNRIIPYALRLICYQAVLPDVIGYEGLEHLIRAIIETAMILSLSAFYKSLLKDFIKNGAWLILFF